MGNVMEFFKQVFVYKGQSMRFVWRVDYKLNDEVFLNITRII